VLIGEYKMKKNMLLGVLVIFLVSLSLYAGGTQEPGVTTIRLLNWFSAEDSTRGPVLDVIAHFENENPQIKVDVIDVDFSEHLNQAIIMNNAGDPPDVAAYEGPGAVTLALMGSLASTDDLFSSEFQNDLFKNSYDLTLVKGKHYAIPWAPGPIGFFYQRDIMKRVGLDPKNPPNTIYDFTNAAAKARKQLPEDYVIFQYDTTARVFTFDFTYPFMRAFGAMPIVGDKVDFTSPEIKTYCEWVRSSLENKYFLPGKKMGQFRPLAAQDRLVFGFDGSYLRGIVQSINDKITTEQFNNTWGVAPIPGDKNGKHYSYGGDTGLVVFNSSTHKAAAAKLIQYLVNSDYSLRNFSIFQGWQPATKSALERMPEFNKDPIMVAFIQTVTETVTPLPYRSDYGDIVLPFVKGVQEIITTKRTIDSVLSDVQRQVDAAIKQ
jgi:multiple sugar transport system substrate-binding protein